MLGGVSLGAWQLPGLTSVVPGGHSWPGASRVPPPRWAARAAVSAAGASKRTINLDLFIGSSHNLTVNRADPSPHQKLRA